VDPPVAQRFTAPLDHRLTTPSDGPPMVANFIRLTVLGLALICRNAQPQADDHTAPAEPSTAPEVFGAGVRPTHWRTPADEQLGFHLPPGLSIELVAAEPQITKPLNLAFAADGSLWVTRTVEYPYPAPPDRTPRDGIVVLRDRDTDGRYETVETFATGLNIPIGILPFGDGCLCFSIPSIDYLRDTDGDGQCDRREPVLGPFDTSRDAHGMVNALRMGEDGWVYACHGFNNQSDVAGRDGHRVRLNSGNVFRFRPDGSRVELYSQGQVNPFGMTQDDWGQWYVADCHSKPLTQNLRGACYSSFGRPHDGVGFAPEMMDHLHGSTAIAGVAWLPPAFWSAWPEGGFVSGNVMTSRLNRNAMQRSGATVRGREIADLLTSDDPWFRPVDIQLGPDGNLYFADFYNKIIGHYEVPLDHPERDRTSGRIWRIAPADRTPQAVHPATALPRAEPRRWIAELQSTNPTQVALAREALIADWSSLAEADPQREVLRDALDSILFSADHGTTQRSALLWVRYRIGQPLEDQQLAPLLSSGSPQLRAQVYRVLAEFPAVGADPARLIDGLNDPEPLVVQAAVSACSAAGSAELIPPLLARWQQSAHESVDPVLQHCLRIALRDLLIQPSGIEWLRKIAMAPSTDQSLATRSAVAAMAPALPHAAAADLLIDDLAAAPDVSGEQWQAKLQHAATWASQDRLPQLIELIERHYADRPLQQAALFDRVAAGLRQRGLTDSAELDAWSNRLLGRLLLPFADAPLDRPALIGWLDAPGPEWGLEPRLCGEESAPRPLFSSLTGGEQYIGIRSSAPFEAPGQLEFWLAGHNGFPDQPDQRLNRVCLVDATTGDILREAYPPRNDRATRVRWDLAAEGLTGALVRVRCEDGDPGSAFAWLAIGGFNFAPLEDSGALAEQFAAACRLVREHRSERLVEQLAPWTRDPRLDVNQRSRAALAITAGDPAQQVRVCLLETAISAPDLPTPLTATLLADLGTVDHDPMARLRELAPLLTRDRQIQLARRLSQQAVGGELLLEAIAQGVITNAALIDRDMRQQLDALFPDSLGPRAAAMVEQLVVESTDDYVALATETRRLLGIGQADASRGHALFTKHCANCHQLAGEGKIVGPQLEGVGKRGSERLLEDILTPDRNVDAAFRTTTLVLTDGRVLAGLIRTEDPQTLQLVTNDGQEQAIDVDSIESRHASPRSLMPADLAGQLPAAQLADLLSYLVLTTNQSRLK
jgi:putative heme-binding domain-containing protein